MPPTRTKTTISGASSACVDEERPSQADAVGERAEQQRPGGAGEEHQREEAVALRLGVPERDRPERDEGDQPEPGDAAEADHAGEQHHRPDVVLGLGLAGGRLLRRPPRGEVRQHAEHEHGGDEDRHAREQAAGPETEPEHERRHDDRPERVARVAADVEQRHPARALAAADVGGELRSLRVERGDADAGDEDEHEEEPVARRDGREADADAREREPDGEQPERAPAIGPEAEQRLQQRRGDEQDEHQRRGERVAEVELVGEERQQSGNAAGGEIGGAVAPRQGGHPPPVDSLAHGSSLGAGARSTARELRPPGRDAVASPGQFRPDERPAGAWSERGEADVEEAQRSRQCGGARIGRPRGRVRRVELRQLIREHGGGDHGGHTRPATRTLGSRRSSGRRPRRAAQPSARRSRMRTRRRPSASTGPSRRTTSRTSRRRRRASATSSPSCRRRRATRSPSCRGSTARSRVPVRPP